MFGLTMVGPKRARMFVLLSATVLALSLATDTCAQQADPGTVILDTAGFWRCHYTLKPPVVRKGGAVERVPLRVRGAKINWIMHETPLPPKDWAKSDFDDGAWPRFPGVCDIRPYRSIDAKSPFMALLCMRGKFEVTDPAKVRELALSATYRGGIVVYLNGKEIARGHLPKGGKVGPEQLAEGYPYEKFDYKKPQTRTRDLGKVSVPAGTLRKGVNVLAIEVHRTAYDAKDIGKYRKDTLISWGTCGLLSIRLSSTAAEGIVPNVARPKTFQVWNSTPMTVDCDMDYGDPNEKLRPIEIVGTRNGAFSGKIVVGSVQPIKGLKAVMGTLTGAGAIPASAVQVRYAKPDAGQSGITRRYLAWTRCFGGLEETPPEEVPVWERQYSGRARNLRSAGVSASCGAVVPVWITVNVPADAVPGDYKGTLIITAEGVKPVEVAVNLKVCSYRLPDPHDFHTFVGMIQSPESLAMYYKVPLWSDAHFKYMEKSFKLLGQVGCKVAYLHLVCRSNIGNAQTMVRWIKQPDGTYTYDFTPLDRTLDLVEKYLKKPAVVCLYAWDIHCNVRTKAHGFRGCVKPSTGEVPVSGIDANGKVTEINLPPFGSPGTKELWKPLIDGVVSRLKKRGMEESIMLGVGTDTNPSKQVVEFFTDLLPGVPWVHQRHGRREMFKFHGVPTGYAAFVWGKFADGGGDGWRYPHLAVHSARGGPRDSAPMTLFRHQGEINVAGYHRGFGRQGADFFPVLKGKRQTVSLMARYPETNWRNLDKIGSRLSPGKEGAISTHRFEMIREGVQECEARICIEKALYDEKRRAKLGEDLAARCRTILDERIAPMRLGTNSLVQSGPWTILATCDLNWWSGGGIMGYYWFSGSDWQERSKSLYDAAAEVENRLDN